MCSCSLQSSQNVKTAARSRNAKKKRSHGGSGSTGIDSSWDDYYHLIEMEDQQKKEVPDDDLYGQLAQKERDLILAAELGKALLEKNDELCRRNESLVEDYTLKIDELEQERHALRLRLESLEAEYENTVKELQDDVGQLRQELYEQQQQLTAGDKDKVNIIRELTQQNERLTDQIQKAAEMEGQLVSEVQGLRTQASMRTSMHDHIDQLEVLHAKISELNEKKSELDKRILILTEERDSYSSSLEESQDRILMLEKQKFEQEQQIRSQGREIYELQEVNHQLQAQIENLSQRSSYSSTGPPSQTLFNELSSASVDSEKDTSAGTTQNVFLPQGYPESVSEDYLSYQIWDSVQAFASSITGTLAAQSVLKGIGVGNEQATLLGATLTWILKDGTGMLGRIIFAWMQGTNLDCNAKRCRLMADILNDFAIFLEIIAPIFPSLFTIIICVACICKSIVGVAGGSTRAALSQHQARKNNMADIAVKDGSQETLVNVTALLFSLAITPFITGNQPLTLILYALFTLLHIITNYLAVTSVVMETLNQARLSIIVQEFLKSSQVLSVQAANHQEPVVFKISRKMSIHLGSSVKKACFDEEDFNLLKKIYSSSKFLTSVDLNEGSIHILLRKGCTVDDELQACFQAEVINAAMDCIIPQSSLEKNLLLQKLTQSLNERDAQSVMQLSLKYTKENYLNFKKKLKSKGWVTDRALLGADEWRLDIKKDL